MSSEGPKIVERSYGVAGNFLKWPENQENTGDPWWPPPSLRWPDPGASGGGWPLNLAGVTIQRLRTSLSGTCTVTPVDDALSGPISHGFPMSKRSNSVPGLESSFLGFLEFKKCLGG